MSSLGARGQASEKTSQRANGIAPDGKRYEYAVSDMNSDAPPVARSCLYDRCHRSRTHARADVLQHLVSCLRNARPPGPRGVRVLRT